MTATAQGRQVRDPLSDLLGEDRLVDLSQPLGPQTVLWPGSPPVEATTLADHEQGRGYYRRLSLPEHAGTHLDAPLHSAPGGLSVAELPLPALVRPAVVVDVRDRCGGNPLYEVSRADIEAVEAARGPIPAGSAVLVCTGWGAYASDPERYRGGGEIPQFPGLGVDAARLLVSRRVAGVGIDTLGIDPGHRTDLPAHRVTQPAGIWHLEGLVNLERLPARGAWIVVGAVPLVEGSGCPVRAFAILPPPG